LGLFHVKRSPVRNGIRGRANIRGSRTAKALVWGLISLTILLLLTGCGRISGPQGWAGPTLTDNTLLASLGRGKLSAIDLSSAGNQLWQFPSGQGKNEPALLAIYGTPVVSNGTVFLGGYDGALYALNLSDGSGKWAQMTKSHIVGGPAVSGDTVYVGSADHCLYAFATDSGSLRWQFCTGGKIWSTPVVDTGTVYFGSMDKKVYAVDAATGEPRWDRPFQADGAVTSTPVVVGGKVYVGGLDKQFYALDAATGEKVWSFGSDDWIWNRAVVADGVVYVGNLAGHVYALDANSGEMRWQSPFETPGVVRAAPALVAKTLVVADEDGNVYGLDIATGSEQWSQLMASGVGADLLVAKSKVYISAKSGDVLTLDPSDGSVAPLVAAQ
jgi:outer membrane protein assembly factor BamB